MFFVIDKPKVHRILPILRDNTRSEGRASGGIYLRIEACDGNLTVTGESVEATVPATVYEPGVLFVRLAKFARLFRSIRGQKTLAIQVNADGLLMDGFRMPLESNEMLLYADPAKAPQHCPLNDDASAKQDRPPTDPRLPGFS